MRRIIFSLLCVLLFVPTFAGAADRLFLVPLVEEYFDQSVQQSRHRVLLEWGAIEGNIPLEIEEFILYRQQGEGEFMRIAATDPRQVMEAGTLREMVLTDNDQQCLDELIVVLDDISSAMEPAGPVISEENFHTFMTQLLDSSLEGHDPLQKMLLSRYHPAAAQAAGLAFVDEDIVSTETYRYMLTAVTAAGESLPVGKTAAFSPAGVTILPAPAGLSQIRIAGCSSIHENLDDLRIHFRWQVPDRPEEINLKILTYGYDLFWSETEQTLSPDALRTGIPASLHRVNMKPIVVAGPSSESGPDSYLARDSEENHFNGPVWQRNQIYYYYLAARDISGHYSYLSNPLEAAVVDTQPPVTPWDVHTEEVSSVVPGAASLETASGIALIWDQVNSINYSRYFGNERAICTATATQVCTAASSALCQQPENVRCADLDIQRYHILRFSSARKAATWGTDSDKDLWPDELELGAGTDPCSAMSFPAVEMPARHIVVEKDSPGHLRQLTETHGQFYFVDTEIDPAIAGNDGEFNNVFYYRIFTEDSNGNVSPLSPPIRAVLYDRRQPDAAAELQINDCHNYTATLGINTYENVALTLIDLTGQARDYKVWQLCDSFDHYVPPMQLITSGIMGADGIVHIEDLSRSCEGGIPTEISVDFADDRGMSMAGVLVPMAAAPTDNHGALTLEGTCLWTEVNTPYQVADGLLKVCSDLEAGETARVYYETDNGMSPVANISYDPDSENGGQSCVEIADMAALVSTDLCMGVRVFSADHVSSGMYFLNCLEMVQSDPAPPPPPLMEGVIVREMPGGEPYFEASWSAPADGMAAFVVSLQNGSLKRYKTIFPDSQGSQGQYVTELMLDPLTDLGKEWCVQVRGISQAMQKSGWSQPSCSTWEEADPDNLAWPKVYTPPESGTIQAFFINENPGYGRPALLLSDDLTLVISNIACGTSIPCSDSVPVCDGSSNCATWVDEYDEMREDVSFSSPVPGRYVEKTVSHRNFMVYRQEAGRDFVQVSPLVQDFSFHPYTHNLPECKTCQYTSYRLQDPFYFLRNFSSTAIGGIDGVTGSPLAPEEFEGIRMVFLDRYPFVGGSTVRYQLVFLDPQSGEPKTISTSNWLTIP